ncbi:hypothetical protein MFLAVUS_011227 [Mucor flavus]|uniref:Uncharacterized protein n=1 Tax=Mucor flavus TaxID=439312 RepID=A0ABP9ZEX7_9FUNG
MQPIRKKFNDNNKNVYQENTSKSNIDNCNDCGFEIDDEGCVCASNCNNIKCEDYDEDWDELCNVCINRLDNNFILNEELDELYEESKSTLSSDIEMEEEVYDERSSETSKNRKKYSKLNENEENIKRNVLCFIK